MLLLLFTSVLTLGAVSPSDDHVFRLQRGGCPMFWYNFNGRCYKYISTHMTWADAELHCLSQGANLVSIHSQAENDFVKTLIKNFDHAQGWTWIGLSDIHKEGRWMWSDGCLARFFFWGAGEPNNLGNEDCVHTSHRWNDCACSSRYPSVCASRKNCP
ncbi:lactose-binding lectin l-2-like [Notolabrus celidotus]|uniref:lactose-binding lectin l-2-like n=1 Tax=Notolabrus celidotus TaxID=1203425 RepID=UPI00148F53EE|nr:lactose-binding lectin l-2-like [Notolabrus celidotus]